MKLLFNISLPICVVALSATPGELHAAERMPRAQFYRSSDFGSIAIVDGVNSFDEALGHLIVRSLEHESCFNVERKPLWFLLNHREISSVGDERFFGIVVRSTAPTVAQGSDVLHLTRNENWIGEAEVDGQRLSKFEFTGQSSALRSFLALQETGSNEATVVRRRAELDVATRGPWHARLPYSRQSSWAYRQDFIQASGNDSNYRTYLAGYLIRFTVTDATTTSDPVIFGIDVKKLAASGYTRFSLVWFSSTAGGNEQSLEIRTDGSCSN